MATDERTVERLLAQLSPLSSAARPVRAKAMFGEYGLFVGDVLIALVCDDRLYLKITQAGQALLDAPVFNSPYPGARPHFEIAPERWADAAWLVGIAEATLGELEVALGPPARPGERRSRTRRRPP
jgi:TfoX/Sxy family transcriptional regulator of competence genes